MRPLHEMPHRQVAQCVHARRFGAFVQKDRLNPRRGLADLSLPQIETGQAEPRANGGRIVRRLDDQPLVGRARRGGISLLLGQPGDQVTCGKAPGSRVGARRQGEQVEPGRRGIV